MLNKKVDIYLDTAAATPLDPRVRLALQPYFSKFFANPTSLHAPGVAARQAVETARAKVAKILSVLPVEIIFTGGGTEANNLAIFGVAGIENGHIITSVIEHASILEPCRALERAGAAVTYLPVRSDGLIEPTALAKTLRPETILVSIGYANNEIGVIQPIRELAKIIRRFKKAANFKLKADSYPYFHTDACQAARFLDCRGPTLGVDLLTLNSGKIYGPRGAGCLYVRRGLKLAPRQFGGGQEHGRRSGTENVPAIVGFAAALELCAKLREKETARLVKWRDYFTKKLLTLSGGNSSRQTIVLNGSASARLPNNINASFPGADGEFVVLSLDAAGVAASTGSACSATEKRESSVVAALGGDAAGAVRFTLGRETTKADLDYVLKILPDILSRAQCQGESLPPSKDSPYN